MWNLTLPSPAEMVTPHTLNSASAHPVTPVYRAKVVHPDMIGTVGVPVGEPEPLVQPEHTATLPGARRARRAPVHSPTPTTSK